MNTKFKCSAALLLSIPAFQLSVCFAQNSAFTYQGRFTENGTPFTGTAEMQFTLWDAASNGTQVATTTPASAFVTVTNGLFTVPIDFGAAQFNGADRWIQIDARTAIGPFTTLQPRQKVTSTPYAIRAASLSGTLPSNQLAGTYGNTVTFSNAGNLFVGTFTGSGATLSNVNAATLGGLTAGQFWKTTGNAGTVAGANFVGTTDNQALEIKVNGTRALRVEPDTNGFGAPNVIGGSPANFVDPGVIGATIAGGGVLNYTTNGFEPGLGSNRVSAVWGTIGGGRRNTVAADHSFIGSGHDNLIQNYAYDSVIGGGTFNTISNFSGQAVIGGGNGNTVGNSSATVGGGGFNNASGFGATAGGGYGNIASGSYATVPGGNLDTAAGSYSFAAGHQAKANHDGTFVWADGLFGDFSSTGNNQFLIRASGNVGINTASPGAALEVRTTNITGNVIRFGFASGGVGNLIAGPSRVGIATDSMAEKISINQGTGYVGINNIAPQTQLHVLGQDGAQLRLQNSINNSFWNIYSESFNNSGYLLFVAGSGNFIYFDTAGVVHSASDKRLKRDINPLGSVLNRVMQLRPVSYQFRSQTNDAPRTLGLIAQEVEPLFPEVVGEHAGMKSLAYSELIPVAIGAVQELNQKLTEELKRRDAENAELKQRLERLEKILLKNSGR